MQVRRVRVKRSEGSEVPSNRFRLQRPEAEQETAPPAGLTEERVDIGRVLLWLVLSILSLGAWPALARGPTARDIVKALEKSKLAD